MKEALNLSHIIGKARIKAMFESSWRHIKIGLEIFSF